MSRRFHIQRLPCPRAWATLVLGLTLEACGRPDPTEVQPPAPEPPGYQAAAPFPFQESEALAGLDFVHVNGMVGELYFHEIMGSGVALFDFNNSGLLDVFLVQGHSLGEREPDPPRDRLFRNDLEVLPDGTPEVRFTDVTEESGIRSVGYGMGVIAADFDGDGWDDLYVTNFGPNQLWRNNGDETFSDVTESAGVGDSRWSVPAVAFDFDRDGHLDLFVGNYVDFTLETHQRCTTDMGEPNYCGPLAFRPYRDALFRNLGDGTFEEVSARKGLDAAYGGALGAVVGDFSGDGWLDLYVANDGVPNQLWINQQGQGFRNEALLAGVALNAAGEPEASMGVDAGDFDNDGDEDLFMTHLTRETNTLYVNQGDTLFVDRSLASGLGLPSWDLTGFGTAFLDFDNDGHLDVLVVNGAVRIIESLARAGDSFPLHQRNLLFRNQGDGTFVDISAQAGPAFARSEVSRGAAFGDLDNNGAMDVVISNNNGPVRVLLNQVGSRNPWIGLRLVTGDPPRDALGAWVALEKEGRPIAWRRVRAAASYGSSNDPRVLFGLGDHGSSGPFSVAVMWPDGSHERFTDLEVRAYTTLSQGTGQAVGDPGPSAPSEGDRPGEAEST